MVVDFNDFNLCNVLCREGLWSTPVDLGVSFRGAKSGVKARIVNTKVAHLANIPLFYACCLFFSGGGGYTKCLCWL